LAAVRNSGKIAAMLVDEAEYAQPWIQEGVRVLCCGVDIPLISRILQQRKLAFDFPKDHIEKEI
jgi:2-keto-3-deoxy-L-rhamnonate aldolase RhmA